MSAEYIFVKVTTSDMNMVTLCIHACSKISVDNTYVYVSITYAIRTTGIARGDGTHERAKNSFKHTIQRTQLMRG